MNSPLTPHAATIADSLRKCAVGVEQVRPEGWNFALTNGSHLQVAARIAEGWLLFDAPAGKEEPQRMAWDLLQWHARLSGPGKFAWQPESHSLRLRAEFPLDEQVDLAGRVQQACAGLLAALRYLHGEQTEEPAEPGGAMLSDESPVSAGADLPGLCEETGWRCQERSPGKLAVELEVPGGYHEAQVEEERAATGRGVRAWVALLRGECLSPESRQALGVLLLTAGATLRMVRAAVQEESDRATARFEVRFATPPCAAEFAHALSALSVACRLYGREAEAVQDRVVAGEYLAARGLAA